MDLPDAWNNYKALLSIIKNNDTTSVRDFLNEMCSPLENLTNSTKLTQIFALAIQLKNCEIVSVLLQHGVRGKPCEELFKYTPMQNAVISGHVSLILEMVQYGVTFDDVDNDGNTLLHLAIANKNERWKNVEVSHRMFLKSQTEEMIVNTLDILLGLGLNVNALNKEGESALSLAVKYRMKKVTQLLVERNASLNIFDKSVSHALIMDEVQSSRRKEADSNKTEDGGELWVEQQKQSFMEWWFSKKLDINCQSNLETPLQLCARYHMKNILQILLKYTNEIDVLDAVGRTLLHILIGTIERSLRAGDKMHGFEEAVEIAKLLIEKGIYVNETDKCGNTAFHVAGKLKRPEIIRPILKRFTNVNARNNVRETPLHIIMKNCSDEYGEEYFEIVSELIRKGANINCQNRYGKTPLHFVCLKNTEISKSIIQFLLVQKCDVNIKDENGVTPLYIAIQAKNSKIIQVLMNNGAEANCCDKKSKSTPLHEATKKNLPAVVESLLAAGAKPDIRDALGQTPLHMAVSDCYRSPAIMSLLLKFGADVEVLDNDKKTPLRRAFDANDYRSAEMLLDFGAKITIEKSQLVPSRSESKVRNTKTLIIKHLVAQSLAGFFVRKCYRTVVKRAERDFASFYEQCSQELVLMKVSTINDVSVYDLIRMNFKRRYTYINRDSVKDVMTDYGFLKDRFPVYRHIISASYWLAVQRKPLFDSTKCVWYQLTNFNLPEICIEQLLSYLQNSDLKFMIEAVI